jgi:CHAT domain-containing protein
MIPLQNLAASPDLPAALPPNPSVALALPPSRPLGTRPPSKADTSVVFPFCRLVTCLVLHALLSLFLLLHPDTALAESPPEIGRALQQSQLGQIDDAVATLQPWAQQYQRGQTDDAITTLRQLLRSMDYETDRVAFIQTARGLLYLYWRTEDAAGLSEVIGRGEEVLKSRTAKDDVDRVLVADLEAYRVREHLLRGDTTGARQLGLRLLDDLQTLPAIQLRVARINVLLTLAMISRAEYRLSEAESYMAQAIGLVLEDKKFFGLNALEFLDAVLRHYVESGNYQYAALVASRIAQRPSARVHLAQPSILAFSVNLLEAELLLQSADSSDSILRLLLWEEQIAASVQHLPYSLRAELYAVLLCVQIWKNETDGAKRTFSKLDALYHREPGARKGLANVLGWAARRLGQPEVATRYAREGHAEPADFNIYRYPLNRLVSAQLDQDARRSVDAKQHALEAFGGLLKLVAIRAGAAPSAPIYLSFVERALVYDFLHLAGALTRSRIRDGDLITAISLAVQLLQRDRMPQGAVFAPALRLAPTANVEEHLRAREHLAHARYREVQRAIDLLVERVALSGPPPASSLYDVVASTRFFEYSLRLNELDAYLESGLESRQGFAMTRLALVLPGDLQRVLEPDEALVSHIRLDRDRLLIECLTRDRDDFFVAPWDRSAIASDVTLLRLSLTATHAPSVALDSQYPVDSALRLYRTFFAPAQSCLADKTRLIIGTHPALLGIPFNGLLTDKPSVTGDGYDLRGAPWMIRKWALAIALSRSTLLYQRSVARFTHPRRSLLGFGNPRFEGPAGGQVGATRSVYTEQGTARVESIRALPALPETETELQKIAAYLAPSDSVLFFGDDATERNVRGQDLGDYRVLAFATHGLTAGEMDSLAEPALALTPGDPQDTRNDGLLTMSEISRLWVGADLVVLSACNTAAGDGTPGAYGFHGLVNAFLFAGAQGVLASQWPVISQMASELTTGMFGVAAVSPNLPPSVALQRAMLRIIDEYPDRAYAHPRFWAPFLLVGDGVSPVTATPSPPATLARVPLSTRWEETLGEKLYGEILGVATASDGGFYAVGVTEPRNKRAQSLVLATNPDGTERWRVTDSVVSGGAHIVPYALGRLATDGSVWSPDRYGGVVLRGLNAQSGAEVWRIVFDSPQDDHTLGLFTTEDGNLLWIVGSRHEPGSRVERESLLTVTLVTVDGDGHVVSAHVGQTSMSEVTLAGAPAAIRWHGQVLLALTGQTFTSVADAFGKSSTDVVSGYFGTPCMYRQFTGLVRIEESTGRITAIREIDNVHVKSFRLGQDGRLLASAEVWDRCLGKSDAAVVEVAVDLSIRTMFRYGGPLEKFAGELATLPDGRLVLVGKITVLFDLDPYAKRDGLDPRMLWPGFTGEFFANDRRTWSAFVVLLDRDGQFLADRVIRDLRGRLMGPVAVRDDGSILFGGFKNGVSSWLGILETR